MRQIQKMKQAVKDMRKQLDEEKHRSVYKFSRLTLPELKTLEKLYGKIEDGDGLKALEDEELDEFERLHEKAADPNAPDVTDPIQDDTETPFDF